MRKVFMERGILDGERYTRNGQNCWGVILPDGMLCLFILEQADDEFITKFAG